MEKFEEFCVVDDDGNVCVLMCLFMVYVCGVVYVWICVSIIISSVSFVGIGM